ncbi:hypothetical protein [Paraclostridium sordellii]|uniref:hypothetical protein n=1 Tax=Paraclostridium sordellii TaxID=1505 RepID=UPI0005E6BF0B|nr:hypothetical protein [Paeniclostridium sordellii]CEP82660.1 Uncharacterised protein [[Clostridium] sordellii] [Paeniclostridium sordellii]
MRLTDRDIQIIDFIKSVGITDTETISKIFFAGGLRTCQIRLKKLVDNKYLKRIDKENFLDQHLFYVNKKPMQIKHKLLFSKFVAELVELGATIIKIKCPYQIANIIPDGFIAFELDGEKKTAFVEIELSKYFKVKKYDEFYYSKKWKELLPTFPSIVVVSDKKVQKSNAYTVIDIKTNFEDIRNIYFS